jgi:hypothetical protein
MLALLAAGAVSFLAGFASTDIASRAPCQGEGLACNIDQAIGAYGVVIFAILGPVIYGVTLVIARNRVALLGAMIVLFVPPVAFYLITGIEHAFFVGLEPYAQFRTFLVMVLPPMLTIVVQAFVLRLLVPRWSRGG